MYRKAFQYLKPFLQKSLKIFAILLALTFALPNNNIFAQEEPSSADVSRPDIFPPPNPEPGFLGQDHSYSVTFRGNGEAVVALKVALTNKGETPLTDVSLRVPRVTPQEFFVYQVIRDPICIRYLEDNSCAEYQDPDYYGYYWSAAKYQKAQSDYSGDTLSISLPQPIAQDKPGSYLVYFRAPGYAKKNIFQAYNFTFETLKVEDDIRNLTVGISTDSDLFLRGAKGKVDYRFDEAATTFRAVGGAAPAASGAIDTFYNQIGGGEIIKTASSLAPLESYSVTSSFADSRIKLYGKEIAVGFGLFLSVLVAVTIFIKKVWKGPSPKPSTPASFDSNTLALSVGVSFGSALLVAGYTVLAILASTYLAKNISYDLQAVVTIFIVVISFAVYALFLFAPGIWLGVKKGLGWGIATVIFTIIWLVIILGIGFFLFLLLRAPQDYPGPITPLRGLPI